MADIATALSHLLSSILEILQSILTTILSAFNALFSLFRNTLASIIDLMSGFVGFVLGNIVIIGLLGAAFVGYSVYARRGKKGGKVL